MYSVFILPILGSPQRGSNKAHFAVINVKLQACVGSVSNGARKNVYFTVGEMPKMT